MIRVLLLSPTAPEDPMAAAQRVEWLLGGLTGLGVQSRLVVLKRTRNPSGGNIGRIGAATHIPVYEKKRPSYIELLFGSDGGFEKAFVESTGVARAVSECARITEEFKPDAILATASLAVAEAGFQLAERTGIPLIIDWHDPLALRPIRMWHSKRYHEALVAREASWVARAKLNLLTAPSQVRLFAQSYPEANIELVPLGWKDVDGERNGHVTPRALLYSGSVEGNAYGFAREFPHLRAGRRIRHWLTAGRLYYTPFNGGSEYCAFGQRALTALAGMLDRVSSLLFRGSRFSDSLDEEMGTLGLSGKVQSLPWIGHDAAQLELRRGHVLWLCLAGTGDGDGEPVIACKAFSYLASGRPIVAVVPPRCDTAEVLRGHGGVFLPDPRNEGEIADAFATALALPPEQHFARDVEEFGLECLGRKLVGAIERALGRTSSTRRSKTGHALKPVVPSSRRKGTTTLRHPSG